MLNEERFVAGCLDSVLAQLDDLGDCEVLCMDGASTDRTREIVLRYASKDPRIRLLDNPQRIQSTAMNTGIRGASGEIIIRLDCHASYAPEYLKNCVELLRRTGADDVGGYIDTKPGDDTPVARANAAAVSHRFGVGGSAFRIGGGEMAVDTVPFGCFSKSLFDRLGMYDERLLRNEDLELSDRIRKAGGKIIISPSIRATYFMRPTFSGMRRQAFDNGLWNTYMLHLLHGGLSPRHLVPLCFVSSVLVLGAGGFFFRPLWYVLLAEIIVYISIATAAAASLARRTRTSMFLIILSFLQLHVSYGLGSLWGMIDAPFRFRARPVGANGEHAPDSIVGERQAQPSIYYRRMKRVLDIALSVSGLILTSPVVALALIVVWLQDRHMPLYRACRTGKGGKSFTMYKIRTMKHAADKANVWATAKHDSRITPAGSMIRACKLDELPQLWNVLKGDMSLVGPRPLALSETAAYTDVERGILSVPPGITDMASIVFADEGSLLAGSANPDADYDQLIRPWKSRLALLYVRNRSLGLDLVLVLITMTGIFHRPLALRLLGRVMTMLHADEMLVRLATGEVQIEPVSPPGSESMEAI